MIHYHAILNGKQTGPHEASEVIARGLRSNTLVWAVGMAEWIPARQVPELFAAMEADVANRPPPPPMSFDFEPDYLFFDPTRPKVLGLVVLYGMVVSPLVYLLTCVTGLVQLPTGPNPDRILLGFAMLGPILGFLSTALIFAASVLLRGRHRLGIPLTVASLGFEAVGGLLMFLLYFIVTQTTGVRGAPLSNDLMTIVQLLVFVVTMAAWLFEWLAVAWMLGNWQGLRHPALNATIRPATDSTSGPNASE